MLSASSRRLPIEPARIHRSRHQLHSVLHTASRTRGRSDVMAGWRGAEGVEVDAETKAKRLYEKQMVKDAGLVKRKVGLYVGYVGTDYSGLQLSGIDHVKTIEGDLQTALCRSGCITESNSVSLGKVKWSRSSRTDKGVHSLATVIALKCLVDETKYDADPEGLELARKISASLPPGIRVFAVQRVNDGFFARKACISRQYNYYVPFSLITGSIEPLGEAEEKECLERFRAALEMFCGRHAFHNYTKHKQYIGSTDSWSSGRRFKQKRRHAEVQVVEEDDAEGPEDAEDEGQEATDDFTSEEKSSSSAADYEALIAKERETGRWRFWNVEFKELDDEKDRVVAQHYRNILSFTADDPAPLVPGLPFPCGYISSECGIGVEIRYMIGTAVAYARKIISHKVLESSLKACIRINLPLALPEPLILVDNEFSDFPSNKGQIPFVSQWSGLRLELRAGGKAEQQQFCEEMMMPEINRLLSSPAWERWSEMVKLVRYDESTQEDVMEVMHKYDAWVKEKKDIKDAKQEALQKLFDEKRINRELWMEERRAKAKRKNVSTAKTKTVPLKPPPEPLP